MTQQDPTRTVARGLMFVAALSLAGMPAIGAPIRAMTATAPHLPASLDGGITDHIILAGSDDGAAAENRKSKELDKRETTRIILRLRGAKTLCENVVRAYRIDCLANQYEKLAQGLPKTGDLGNIKQAIDKAANDLAAIASANQDTSVKTIRPRINRGGVRARASRPIKAIQPARQARAERQARAVVDELSTVLLRSAENSEKRQVYFASIAQAVDSNKVLLRSA